MKQLLAITASIMFLASSVQAAEVAEVAAKVDASEKVCASECSSCPIKAAMDELPKFTYQVGKEKTCCAEAAAALAKKHDAPMEYLVGDKAFPTKAVAMVALTDATEKYVAAFATPKTCKESGKTTVAGKELCCEVVATERATLAKKAMAKVQMTYLVGEKECHCPTEAKTLAKSSGDDQLFVVAGEKTCCSTTARLNLARAKYKAAIEALAKADAPKDAKQS